MGGSDAEDKQGPGLKHILGLRGVAKDKALRELFEEMDQDYSGTLDVNELWKALRSYGIDVSKAAARSILSTIDKDESGTIDEDEFVEFFRVVEDLENFKDTVEVEKAKSSNRVCVGSVYIFVSLMLVFALVIMVESNPGDVALQLLLNVAIAMASLGLFAVVFLPLILIKCRPKERYEAIKVWTENKILMLKMKLNANSMPRFEVMPRKDCFPGTGVHQMPATDLSVCKFVCVQRGLSVFVVCDGVAYFKRQGIETCEAKLVDNPKAVTYFNSADVPPPKEVRIDPKEIEGRNKSYRSRDAATEASTRGPSKAAAAAPPTVSPVWAFEDEAPAAKPAYFAEQYDQAAQQMAEARTVVSTVSALGPTGQHAPVMTWNQGQPRRSWKKGIKR